jgi:hypothetical protein
MVWSPLMTVVSRDELAQLHKMWRTGSGKLIDALLDPPDNVLAVLKAVHNPLEHPLFVVMKIAVLVQLPAHPLDVCGVVVKLQVDDGRSRPIVWVVVIAIGAIGDSSSEVFSIKRPGVREEIRNQETTDDHCCKSNSDMSFHLQLFWAVVLSSQPWI